MNPRILSFIQAVVGDDASKALRKAADRDDTLASVIGARTIVGWLGLVSRWGYEGEVPGFPGSFLRFAKSEDGLFDGEVRFGKNTHEFQRVDLPYVAAGLSVVLGADQPPDEDLRDTALVALGDNIDLLLKTQVIKKAEEESSEEGSPCCNCDQGHHERCEASGCGCGCGEEDLEKAGGTTAPGEAATQRPPAGPVDGGFTAPRSTQARRSKKRGFGAKLAMSQTEVRCSVCEEPQFRGERFTGCFCMRDLAKHAKATAVQGGYYLEFDPDVWSKDDVSLLMDIVEGK